MAKTTGYSNSLKTVAFSAIAGMLMHTSCSNPANENTVKDTQSYFSLQEYFEQEAQRLQGLSPSISKAVVKSGEMESHEIQVKNWKIELELFIASDINKAAWQGSYKVDSTSHMLTYKSLDPELRTVQVNIQKNDDGSVKHIYIVNHTKNMLYEADEKLSYYPDSIYQINKRQRVRVLGENTYDIIGKTIK